LAAALSPDGARRAAITSTQWSKEVLRDFI
jgi:hypothetical protein